MTSRVTSGLARVLPVLLISGALVVVVAAALLAACGGSDGGGSPAPTATGSSTASSSAAPNPSSSTSPSPSEAPAALTTVTLYFLRHGSLCAVERRLPRTPAPAKATLEALFKGPAAAERNVGVTTALPSDIKLESISIAGGKASVSVSCDFSGADENAYLASAAEIVYSLTRFQTVRTVSIQADGKTLPAAGEAGGSSATWRRRDFRELEPAIFVESPGLGAVLHSPFVLSGSAAVFEGTFVTRLVDNGGRRIVNLTVQASQGAPGRGRFRKDVAFSTSATKGSLIVYSQSMEDGSRQNLERIPVTFATD